MPPDKTVERLMARITELEIKQTYYDGSQDDLDRALIRMQEKIDTLLNEINKIRTVIESRPEQPIAPLSEETPPPHY